MTPICITFHLYSVCHLTKVQTGKEFISLKANIVSETAFKVHLPFQVFKLPKSSLWPIDYKSRSKTNVFTIPFLKVPDNSSWTHFNIKLHLFVISVRALSPIKHLHVNNWNNICLELLRDISGIQLSSHEIVLLRHMTIYCLSNFLLPMWCSEK